MELAQSMLSELGRQLQRVIQVQEELKIQLTRIEGSLNKTVCDTRGHCWHSIPSHKEEQQCCFCQERRPSPEDREERKGLPVMGATAYDPTFQKEQAK